MQNILRAIIALLVFLVLFIYLAFWERWDYTIFLLPLWWFLLLQMFSLHQNFTKCILDENEDVFYFILMGKTHSFAWNNIKATQTIYRDEDKKQVYGLIIYTHTDYSFFVKEQHFRGGFPMNYFRFRHKLEPIVVTEIVS